MSQSTSNPRSSRAESPRGGSREQGMDYCLRLLSARAYTCAELDRKLIGRGYDAETIGQVLDRLGELDLVDDRTYARDWAQSRHARTGRGRTLLGVELRRKGVADDHVRAALSEISDDAERDAAIALVQRELRSRNKPVDEAGLRRIVGKLARRGFAPGLAYSVARAEFRDQLASGDIELPDE